MDSGAFVHMKGNSSSTPKENKHHETIQPNSSNSDRKWQNFADQTAEVHIKEIGRPLWFNLGKENSFHLYLWDDDTMNWDTLLVGNLRGRRN